MYTKWTEISYNQYPSFASRFQRSAYEEWKEDDYLDYDELLFTESEEDTCWDWKNKYMFTL